MKVPALSAVLLALSAFFAGWWLRGGTPVRRAAEAPESATPAVAGNSAKEGRALLPTKRPRSAVEGFSEADRRREADDRARLEERCKEALERRITAWERELALDPRDAATLRQAVVPIIAATDPPLAALALPLLEERLKSLLDEDRQAAFAQLASRRADALVKAKVQARLAELNSVIVLDPAQELAAGEALAEQADQLPDPAVGPGGDLAPAALAEITRRLVESGDDGSGYTKVASDVVREGIEAEVRRFTGVLADDQLESYRAHLEEKHARWLLLSP